ncbi:MAG: GNAT family N-acetyltransferase [Desulfovermiculus sp.]
MNLKERAAHELQGAAFLVRNLWACFTFRVKPVPAGRYGPVTITGTTLASLREIQTLHAHLRGGRKLNLWRLVLLSAIGNRLCPVAKDDTGKIVGFQLLYFRETEWRQSILHEAFIGVYPEYRGAGIGTSIRQHSFRHFKDASMMAGISSQTQATNIASLRSAKRAGFVVRSQSTEHGPGPEQIIQLYCPIKDHVPTEAGSYDR